MLRIAGRHLQALPRVHPRLRARSRSQLRPAHQARFGLRQKVLRGLIDPPLTPPRGLGLRGSGVAGRGLAGRRSKRRVRFHMEHFAF